MDIGREASRFHRTTTMISKPLYVIEAVQPDGEIVGVAMRSSPGCGAMLPTYVPRHEAARLHQTEARKLRKWAIAHGMNARTRLVKPAAKPQGRPADFGKIQSLLGSILG